MKLLIYVLALFMVLTGCASSLQIQPEYIILNKSIDNKGVNNAIDYKKLNYPLDDYFNFVIAYDSYGCNIINTFEGYIVKDLVSSQAKADIKLSSYELYELYKILVYKHITNMPDNYTHYSPWQSFGDNGAIYFYININGVHKKASIELPIPYTDYYGTALRDFYQVAKSMVEKKKEYKSLPKRNGAYI